MQPMNPKEYRNRGPEGIIQDAIIKYLSTRKWYVMQTHGNMFQSGLPDLWASHKTYGPRWIEVKLPHMIGSKFTPAQLDVFPKICSNGSGVWILTADNHTEYMKLFDPPNWWKYLSSWKGG